jgi:hypothetical protein
MTSARMIGALTPRKCGANNLNHKKEVEFSQRGKKNALTMS